MTLISSEKHATTCYKSTYENILLMGNLNRTPSNSDLDDLINDYELQNLSSRLTCFMCRSFKH